MPRLPNVRRAPRRQAPSRLAPSRLELSRPELPWRLFAVAAVVTVGSIGLGAALVEPAPGRIVATDEDQVGELTGARPVSVAGPAPQDVVEGSHLRPSPPASASASQSPEEDGRETGRVTDPRSASPSVSSEPSPVVTAAPEPRPSTTPSPSAVSPTPTAQPTPTPEPSAEPEPGPTKPSWWPW